MPRLALCLHFATAAMAAWASDPVSPDDCRDVGGVYSIRGVRLEGDLPARDVMYMEGVLDAQQRIAARYFSFEFDVERQQIDVTIFDEGGGPIRVAHSAVFQCRNGLLTRESSVRGGSEGCSKSMETVSSVRRDAAGLKFESTEVGRYGAGCGPDTVTRRVITYPAYRH